ncbi:hypothetical protein, partial [Klebsiella electrica]|uniref:hypothetical protein n=1 Tax=Klebsiella electrica TaxID=1259973 RepID=UPI003F75ADF1
NPASYRVVRKKSYLFNKAERMVKARWCEMMDKTRNRKFLYCGRSVNRRTAIAIVTMTRKMGCE